MFMKTLLLAILLLFSTTAAARWGAISYSPSDRVYGYSYDWGYAQKARNRANRQCRSKYGSRDCRVVVTFQRCGALAVSKGRKYGAGKAPYKGLAKERALRNCRNKGGRKCRARVAVCN